MTAEEIVTLTLRVPHGLRYRLKTHALLTGTSINETVNHVLDDWLNKTGRREMLVAAGEDAMKYHGAALDALADDDGPIAVPETASDAAAARKPSRLAPMVRAAQEAGMYEKTAGPPPPMRTDVCPRCDYPVKTDRGHARCTNKACDYTRKAT